MSQSLWSLRWSHSRFRVRRRLGARGTSGCQRDKAWSCAGPPGSSRAKAPAPPPTPDLAALPTEEPPAERTAPELAISRVHEESDLVVHTPGRVPKKSISAVPGIGRYSRRARSRRPGPRRARRQPGATLQTGVLGPDRAEDAGSAGFRFRARAVTRLPAHRCGAVAGVRAVAAARIARGPVTARPLP